MQQFLTEVDAQLERRDFEVDGMKSGVPFKYGIIDAPLRNPVEEGYQGWLNDRCPISWKKEMMFMQMAIETDHASQEHEDIPRQSFFPKLNYQCDGDTISFVAIGNAGIPQFGQKGKIDSIHDQIGRDVLAKSKEHNAKFVLYLGNNFHEGIKDTDDPG
uniref:AlNc14C192G8482 protein n=1 Tax=Albugo laibachii Nc14 TaxID=890382 RepID=F0WQ02_9STRA|nr:AlNc14C192G8482 [Albugo laibachii Nc14]|eukprot:CCA23405.1 AlNc14C192G8482 [Albugo laibachii Nc14]